LSEVRGVFGYLGLSEFRDCPEFDFEPCFFRTVRFVPREQDMWGENVSRAHGAFDAHASQFSPGVESLLSANAAMETVGMSFLRLDGPAERMKADIATKVIRPEMTFHAGGLAGGISWSCKRTAFTHSFR
jgi:hypothetical protein